MQAMILYHYCSNSSFLSIIGSSGIRASEFSLSNDHLEGKWSKRLLNDFCSKKVGMQLIQRGLLLEQFDGLLEYFGAVGVCLSEDGDLLSQWRGYAADGGGIAIGFDSTFF